MTRDELKNQIDYFQARIEELDKKIINGAPSEKGYKEMADAYNKFVDQYISLLDRLEHFDDADLEYEKLQIEQDKINVESERIRLDREKFAHEIEVQKKQEVVDIVFRAGDLGAKLLVPALGSAAVIYVANLAYMNDSKLELCNGRIIGGVKDLLKIMTMRVS